MRHIYCARHLQLMVILTVGVACSAGAVSTETVIEAPGPLGPLKGTLLAPSAGSGVVILIIPGSGPTDRDGNNPLGVSAAPYRLLAEALAMRGITSVRIDKRGLAGSAGAVADGNAGTIEDYVADVQAWTKVVRHLTGASCVWLLGHSEGGLVAMAASQHGPQLCGLVLVSAPGRPMGEILRDQLKANPANAPLLDRALAAIDELEAGKRVDTAGFPPPLLRLFHPRVQAFLINAFSYDPARLLAGYAKPVLILQGLRDLQVHAEDAKILKAADPNAQLTLLPDVNHVLKTVTSDDRSVNIATYSDASLPLAPGLTEASVGFLPARNHREGRASSN